MVYISLSLLVIDYYQYYPILMPKEKKKKKKNHREFGLGRSVATRCFYLILSPKLTVYFGSNTKNFIHKWQTIRTLLNLCIYGETPTRHPYLAPYQCWKSVECEFIIESEPCVPCVSDCK